MRLIQGRQGLRLIDGCRVFEGDARLLNVDVAPRASSFHVESRVSSFLLLKGCGIFRCYKGAELVRLIQWILEPTFHL